MCFWGFISCALFSVKYNVILRANLSGYVTYTAILNRNCIGKIYPWRTFYFLHKRVNTHTWDINVPFCFTCDVSLKCNQCQLYTPRTIRKMICNTFKDIKTTTFFILRQDINRKVLSKVIHLILPKIHQLFCIWPIGLLSNMNKCRNTKRVLE